MEKPRSTLITITGLSLGVFLVTLSWMELGFPPFYIYGAFGFAGISLLVSALANLGAGVFHPTQRVHHLAWSIVVFVVLAATLWLRSFVPRPEQRWFLRGGMQAYSLMVDRIREKKTLLTSEGRPLQDIVGRGDVLGKTNVDGSLTVLFRLRSNVRGGYLYYEGGGMVAQPGENIYFLPDTRTYYVHITNKWYRF